MAARGAREWDMGSSDFTATMVYWGGNQVPWSSMEAVLAGPCQHTKLHRAAGFEVIKAVWFRFREKE